MRNWIAALLLLSAVGFSGCAEMQLKRALPDEILTMAIPVFRNATSQPGVDQELTELVRRSFIVDGRLNVVDESKADAVLRGVIQRYDKLVLSQSENQVPYQYKLQVVVDLEIVNTKTGEVIATTQPMQQPSEGDTAALEKNFDSTNVRSLKRYTTYYVLNNVGVPPEDEQTARTRVLEMMAQRVVERTIGGF